MRSRKVWGLAGILAVVALVFALAAKLMMRSPGPDRIVLIVVDTLRRDFLSCYGGPVSTPNIDRLAARGQLFANALSSFHQTTMSMGAMFTGKTPSFESSEGSMLNWNGRTWCGMARFARPSGNDECLPSSLRVLGEVLHDRGYWTIGVVSNALLFAPSGFQRGFDEWLEVGERLRDTRHFDLKDQLSVQPGGAEQVNAAVKEVLKRRPHDRFFLYLHYMDVHEYKKGAAGRPDWRKLYGEAVARVDAAIGAVIGELETAGLIDGTVFVFTADHGERLKEPHFTEGLAAFEPEPGIGHEGNPSFEELLKVPLIVSPAHVPDADLLVRTEDLFRLIADIVGATVNPPELLDKDELFLTELFWRTYRRGRWKSFWDRRVNALSLVDLDTDPLEQRDIAASHPEIAEQHRNRGDLLGRALTASAVPSSTLTSEDEERLRALGYLPALQRPPADVK